MYPWYEAAGIAPRSTCARRVRLSSRAMAAWRHWTNACRRCSAQASLLAGPRRCATRWAEFVSVCKVLVKAHKQCAKGGRRSRLADCSGPVLREPVVWGLVFGAGRLGPGVRGGNCLGPVSRLSVRQSAHETGPQLRRGAGCRLSIDGMAYAIWTSRVYYAFSFGNAIKRALSRPSGIVARGA